MVFEKVQNETLW